MRRPFCNLSPFFFLRTRERKIYFTEQEFLEKNIFLLNLQKNNCFNPFSLKIKEEGVSEFNWGIKKNGEKEKTKEYTHTSKSKL